MAASAAGQVPVTVSYERLGGELREVLDFQRTGYLRAVLRGDFGGSEFTLTEVTCRDGAFVSRDVAIPGRPMRIPDSDSSLRIAFLSREIGPDSVQVGVNLPWFGYRGGFSHAPEFSGSFLLLEPAALAGCDPQNRPREYTTRDTIPVVAYTTGIPRTGGFGEEQTRYFDVCSLRDDRTEPRGWYG